MLWELPASSSRNYRKFSSLARKAIAVNPKLAKYWILLAKCLTQEGEDDEAVDVLTEAISNLPEEHELYLSQAEAYFRIHRLDLMREVLDRSPTIPDSDAEAQRRLLYLRGASSSENVEAARRALALDPTNAPALQILANFSRANDCIETMVPVFQAALARDPCHTLARYQLAVALAMLGKSDEARRLIDIGKFTTTADLASPAPNTDAAAFRAKIVGEILRNPSLKPDPAGKATRHGLQTTSDLPGSNGEAMNLLLDQIRKSIDNYVEGLPEKGGDPFADARPKKVRLEAWAVVYPGDGYQKAHIHPASWLSGVYYVSVPSVDSTDTRCGCLVLGSLELKPPGMTPPWGLLDVRPVPGRLIIFPSFIPHSTIPTKSTGQRICIAFDAVPVRAGRSDSA